ncbi:MAG: SulP family inorganic anion transporter [Flavobacteriales bacterium]|nr:SulP family inorganic anion transporter [Flavobacteriales bacterium]
MSRQLEHDTNSFKKNWKKDLIAGFSVSLIALPLCLGISIASGFPPVAGLITAIVGGMLASRISGSFVTISGPAAGLIVISLSAVETMGGGDAIAGYRYAIAAIFIAGIFSVLLSFLKVGKLGDFFPTAVVHGMMAAIGIIIIVKQSFVAMGLVSPKGSILHVMALLPDALIHMNPIIFLIGLITILILVFQPKIKYKPIKIIPAPVWVLLVAIPFAHFFNLFEAHEYSIRSLHYSLGPQLLVDLPDKLAESIVLPDFSKMGETQFWISVISFTLVMSMETLISAKAVDQLDPQKRKSNLDKDVRAMGAGTAVAGFLGGLPMISEIVRSSANVNYGARSQWANFFHGGCLLLFMVVLSPLIEQIPLAALAALEIYTGFKLAAPKNFRHSLEIGKAQLAIFTITLIAVLVTDLLVGVVIGMLFKLIIHMVYGAKLRDLFKIRAEVSSQNKTVKIKPKGSSIFSNYLSLKKIIDDNLNENEDIMIDFVDVEIVDHTVMQNLENLENDLKRRNKYLAVLGMHNLHPASNHPLAARTTKTFSFLKGQQKSSRMDRLISYAEKNELEFTPQQIKRLDSWKAFDFATSTRVNSVKNRLTGFLEHSRINIADVEFIEGAQTTEQRHRLTIMKIKPEKRGIVPFTLEKDKIFDKVISGWKDINFESHPEFSKFYYLKSENEIDTRAFFTENMLNLFEKYQGLHIESSGKDFTVYLKDGLLDLAQISMLRSFAEEFDKLIHTEDDLTTENVLAVANHLDESKE